MKKLIFVSLILIGRSVMALTEKEKTLCSVAAATARGDLARLEASYALAYGAGWTTKELKEAATQLYAYCGFPKALNALGVLYKVAPVTDADYAEATKE